MAAAELSPDPVGPVRNIEIPRGNQARGTAGKKTVGVADRDREVGCVPGVGEHGAEPVERPGQAARPGRIGAQSLMG